MATAQADVTDSANWSGFAVHRSGVRFRRVSATWTQPRASCVPGQRTFSSFWVGLGGYSLTSRALEQIGTEVDCGRSGAVRSTAWYELVPVPSRPVSLRVRPGDRVSGTVVVSGHLVTLSLRDHRSGRSFKKTVHLRTIDGSSAEWIVEAPSLCGQERRSCQTLPLADFGSVSFSRASAQTARGHRGTISSKAWRATKITLMPGGTTFVVAQGAGISAAEAKPSPLSAGGSQFSVTYVPTAEPAAVALRPRRPSLRDERVIH